MNQGPGENGLRWIADAYDISFTLTLAEGLSPEELLRSVGAEERHIVPLTRSAAYELLVRDEDGHLSDLDFLDWEDEAEVARLTSGGFLPAPPETIVRAGSVAGWAYALEEFGCHTDTYLPALSQRGRAFVVHRNAKGFSHVGYGLHGKAVTWFEPGRTWRTVSRRTRRSASSPLTPGRATWRSCGSWRTSSASTSPTRRQRPSCRRRRSPTPPRADYRCCPG
ncbi:DUF6461 domain-containing protein [Streptomyces cyaneofuscatus]|uniref:DUF6461 domain-containing protein n=1 Tax=Streptomyces cyaneofuscatus TaxID=66883 RepID=UPI00362D6550